MKWILIIVVILIVVLLAISYVLVKLSFTRPTKENDDGDIGGEGKDSWLMYVKANEDGRNWLKENKEVDNLEIESFDKTKLRAIYVNQNTNKTIICVHGYMAKGGMWDYGASIKFLVSTGYNLLIVDDRSHGKSDGKYIGFGVLDSKDVTKWAEYLVKELKQETIVLYGISMGAATVLNVPSCNPPKEIKGIVADCGFASGYDEVSYQIKEMYHLPAFPLIPLANMWLKLLAHYSLKEKEAYLSIKNFKGKLLLVHGDKDLFVKTEDVYRINKNASCDKDLLVVSGASHAKSYLLDKENYEKKFMELLKKIDG